MRTPFSLKLFLLLGLPLAASICAFAMWFMLSGPRQAAQIAPPSLDLSDHDARFAFVSYLRDERTIWGESLIDDCGLRATEVFRVIAFTAFRNPEGQLAEVRLQDNAPVGSSYQFPFPPVSSSGTPPLARRTASRALSSQEFENIERMADRLREDQIPLTHGTLGLDGSALTLEFCRETHYGFYHLYNPAANREQDVRIVEVANAILTSAGETPVAPGVDLTIKSTK